VADAGGAGKPLETWVLPVGGGGTRVASAVGPSGISAGGGAAGLTAGAVPKGLIGGAVERWQPDRAIAA
jgi:hypothetical protein